MFAIKKVACKKEVNLVDFVLELSVTVGYLDADVCIAELDNMELLICGHCVFVLGVMDRGESKNRLHFQMIMQARTESAQRFGIFVRKYMGWYWAKRMSPVGKVMCKVLTNQMIHTYRGMIGNCMKDSGAKDFGSTIFNIYDK